MDPAQSYQQPTSGNHAISEDSADVSQNSSIIESKPRSLPKDVDLAELVREGYDKIAPRYLEWTNTSPARLKYLKKLLACLPKPATVLELGCGAGKPCTQILTEHAEVTGVDISAVQLALAKELAPKAHFIHADMLSLAFPTDSFDAIVAFYSIIHLPREKLDSLICRIADWLRPGGHLLLNLGATDDPGSINQDWLGGAMFWSSYDAQTNEKMFARAGFTLFESEIAQDDEDGRLVPFHWILAKRV